LLTIAKIFYFFYQLKREREREKKFVVCHLLMILLCLRKHDVMSFEVKKSFQGKSHYLFKNRKCQVIWKKKFWKNFSITCNLIDFGNNVERNSSIFEDSSNSISSYSRKCQLSLEKYQNSIKCTQHMLLFSIQKHKFFFIEF
jgi:hypothetical protein